MSNSDVAAVLKFVRRASRSLLVGVLKHVPNHPDADSQQVGRLITAELETRNQIFGCD